jgi:hypothetical protein
MKAQCEHIADGYTAIKDVYPELKGIGDIISNENAMSTQIGDSKGAAPYIDNASSNIDSILDGVLGNGGQVRNSFDKDYAAYMAGQYYAQDKRDRDSSEFAAALSAAGFNAGDVNNPATLNILQTRMLNAINTAIGVNGITDAGNKAKVSDMNEYLITQWQDIAQAQAQAQAVKDDITGLGYNNYISLSGNSTINDNLDYYNGVNPFAMVPPGSGSAGVPGTFFGDKFLS